MNVQTPMVLTVSAYQGHQTEGFADLVPLAGVEVERWYMAPGVHRIPITEDGLTATLFLPPGRTGSESGGRCKVQLGPVVCCPGVGEYGCVNGELVPACLKDPDPSPVSWICGGARGG